MKKLDIIPAWGRILAGYRPLVSLEITKECPLRCPGCYAYEPDHLGGGTLLRQLSDLRGQELIDGVLELVDRLRPIHISIVGGEPLVRYRELDAILPELGARGIEVQLVTSAVRPIPASWAAMEHLHLAVSIDGLQPEHDRRRTPATYDRILRHIEGHGVNIHCTVTGQFASQPGYLARFAEFWSERPEVRKIWFSLFTPQEGQECEERLTPADRQEVVREIRALNARFPKVNMPESVLRGYLRPPESPESCIFAQVTECVSADLTTRISPCQFGGKPVCGECGCMASAGLASVADHRLAGLISLADVFSLSRRIGSHFEEARLARAAPAAAREI